MPGNRSHLLIHSPNCRRIIILYTAGPEPDNYVAAMCQYYELGHFRSSAWMMVDRGQHCERLATKTHYKSINRLDFSRHVFCGGDDDRICNAKSTTFTHLQCPWRVAVWFVIISVKWKRNHLSSTVMQFSFRARKRTSRTGHGTWYMRSRTRRQRTHSWWHEKGHNDYRFIW